MSNRALLIVDHGSRNANANEAIAGFAERVAAARPDWRIAHAHMELAQPDVPSTIEQLVGEGVSEIHIYLHFLGRGFHVRETIPELVDAAHERHPGLRVTVSDPIGEHPKLVELVLETLPDLDG
ncbi:MAG: CbiX/SirB N-terminal domain-containing protein [Myxococcota bacterium]